MPQVEETESSTGSSRMNVITRVAFEKHMVESRTHSLQAREKQVCNNIVKYLLFCDVM